MLSPLKIFRIYKGYYIDYIRIVYFLKPEEVINTRKLGYLLERISIGNILLEAVSYFAFMKCRTNKELFNT